MLNNHGKVERKSDFVGPVHLYRNKILTVYPY